MIIEGLLSILVLGGLLFLFLNWKEKLKSKKLLKKYDEDNDKSKQGEELRSTKTRGAEQRRRNGKSAKAKLALKGFGQSEGSGLLPPTDVDDDGKNGISPRGPTRLSKLLRKK